METDKGRLAEIDEQIASGRLCIADQKRLIEKLVAGRDDVKGAWEQLILFEETLDRMLEQRRLVLKELMRKLLVD